MDATPMDLTMLDAAVDPTSQIRLEREVAELIVSALQLEVSPEDIAPGGALFGEGLGLDSIDALELSMAIAREYGIELKSEQARGQQVFESLRSLATFIGAHRVR